MEELGDALKWIMAIHAKELEDVIHDRANLDYDAELERASALRDEYKRRLAEHTASHRC